MTGNRQAIGFLITWVSSLEGSQLGTVATFIFWSLLWGSGGVWLSRRRTRPVTPER